MQINYKVRAPYPGETSGFVEGRHLSYNKHYPWSHDHLGSRWYLNKVGDVNIVKSLEGRAVCTTPSYLSDEKLKIHFKPI